MYKNDKYWLYRGIKQKVLHEYEEDQNYYWTSFSSTSTTENIAKEFAKVTDYSGKTMSKGTIFKIMVSENYPYHNCNLPEDWSFHGRENEVLLFPFFNFKVIRKI